MTDLNEQHYYKIGDIVAANINDFTIQGLHYIHNVVGKIIGLFKQGQLKGYDIELYHPETFNQYVPTPLTDKYKHEIADLYKPTDLEHKMSIIFVNEQDIYKHCPSQISKNITFLDAIRQLWKPLVFRKVKTVIKQAQNLIDVEYAYINRDGDFKTKTYKSLNAAFERTPEHLHRNIRSHYTDYYGFTTSQNIRDNDPYIGKEIFFSKKCYIELNLGNQPTADFAKNRFVKTWPPRKGQIICGLVENGEKGLFFRKWFLCSKQFLNLWTYINNNIHPNDKQIKDLDTSQLSLNENLNISQQQQHYKIYNIENCALQWPSRYQQIAKLAFKPNLKPTDNFSKKLKREILWMLPPE